MPLGLQRGPHTIINKSAGNMSSMMKKEAHASEPDVAVVPFTPRSTSWVLIAVMIVHFGPDFEESTLVLTVERGYKLERHGVQDHVER